MVAPVVPGMDIVAQALRAAHKQLLLFYCSPVKMRARHGVPTPLPRHDSTTIGRL